MSKQGARPLADHKTGALKSAPQATWIAHEKYLADKTCAKTDTWPVSPDPGGHVLHMWEHASSSVKLVRAALESLCSPGPAAKAREHRSSWDLGAGVFHLAVTGWGLRLRAPF